MTPEQTSIEIPGLWRDPLVFAKVMWPDTKFYDKQREIIYSVANNDETFVPAAHQMGKDYVSGFITLWYFLTHHPVRIITTSVKDDHLMVLWGEIGRFIDTAKYPLDHKKGGPLVIKHRELRKVVNGVQCKISYVKGMVSEKGEGLAGHHAPHTLLVVDEACHDRDTEVLTEVGWKHFYELSGTDKLLSMNPKNSIAEYVKPEVVYTFNHSGPMMLCEKRGANFCVTPNHRMLWRQRRMIGKGWQYYTPYYLEQINKISGTKFIPRCFEWNGVNEDYYTIPFLYTGRKIFPARRVKMQDWVELLGWYLSEGGLGGFVDGIPYNVSISQKDTTVLERLKQICDKSEIESRVITSATVPHLRICERQLAQHLLEISGGRYCYEKRVPQFVQSLSKELIGVFLEAYKNGDGYDKSDGRWGIYTSSKLMADDLQILSYKIGRKASIQSRKLIGLPAPNGISRRDGYVVSISRDELEDHIKLTNKHLQKIHYEGQVYCVKIPPYHTIFTRRGGVCMWGGNSGAEEEVYIRGCTWAKRVLVIGNTYPCQNFFYKAVMGGDIIA